MLYPHLQRLHDASVSCVRKFLLLSALIFYFFQLAPAISFAVDAPARIMALAPSIAELVCSLDACSLLVGRTDYADFNSAVSALPSVGAYNRPDLEKIVSLSPDLCIAIEDGTPPQLIDRLIAFGIRVETLSITDIDSLPQSLLTLGRIILRENEAACRSAAFRNELRRLEELVESRMKNRNRPKILFQLQEDPIIAASEDTFAGKLIQKAGGENVVKNTGGSAYPIIGKEDLLLLSPDLILFTGMASETGPDTMTECNAMGFRVIRVPSDIFTRPSLNSLEALERLIHIFYDDVQS